MLKKIQLIITSTTANQAQTSNHKGSRSLLIITVDSIYREKNINSIDNINRVLMLFT